MRRLDGKVAIVTGGTRGMGEAEVRGLVREGAKVAFCGRDANAGRAIQSELDGHGVYVEMDVSVEADWERLVELTLARFGRLTSLVNNAGIPMTSRLEEMTVDDLDACYRVNQRGPLLGMKHVIGPMRRNGGGSIVNIGSVGALKGLRALAGYAGTKSAIIGITRASAVELAADQIRVNVVHPGFFDTALLATGSSGGGRDMGSKYTPMKRTAMPDEIVGTIVYLLSDESSFVTGTQIVVDGGYTV